MKFGTLQFMDKIQNLHGNPRVIVSDRDPIFTGNFWMDLFSCLGTQLAHSSSYHPQSDGQTEIVNKCLEGYLLCFGSNKQTQWVKWLPLVEWWYNNSFHTAAKMTLFMALCGYHPPSITSSLRENYKVLAVEDHIEHQQKFLQLLKDNLNLAQNQMKQQVYQHRSERSFDVRDWVFLRIHHTKKCPSRKIRRIINYFQSTTLILTRCCKRLVLWHTNWSFLLLHECIQFSMFHA